MRFAKGALVFGLVSLFMLGLFAGYVPATPLDVSEQKEDEIIEETNDIAEVVENDPQFRWAIKTADTDASEPEARPLGSRSNVDLAVKKVTVIMSQTGQTQHYPGQLCTINVTIYNYAVNPATGFTVLCAVNDRYTNSTIQSSVYTKTLASYQNGLDNTTVQFLFTPPLIPPIEWAPYSHTFDIVATVIIANDEVQSNNQRSSTLTVMKADFEPLMKLGVYTKGSGWVNPLGYDPVVADVGETLTIPFVLYNEGQGQDSIQLTCIDKPKNWTVGGFGPMDLDDGENTTDDLNLIVKISKYKQDALENFDYVIKIKAYSLNYPLAKSVMEIHFSIKFAAGIQLIPPYTEKWSAPGVYLNIDVKIKNKGNGKDSFYSSLDTLRSISLKQGWKAYIDAGTLTPAIGRDESYVVKIRVSVPPNVMKGAHAKITLVTKSNKAASSADPVERKIDIEVYASKLHNPVLEAQKPFYEVEPGEESLIYFNLTNRGNGRDPTIQVRLVAQPEGWVTGMDISEIPATGLGFMTTAEIGLKIILPADVPAREGYNVRIEAWAGEPVLFKTSELALSINVLEKFEVSISTLATMKTGYVGGIVEFSANIQNKGNVEDTFYLDAELKEGAQYPGWGIELSDNLINLSANMTKSVIVYVSIPLNASADTNLATSSIFEGYYIQLFVTSQSDPDNATKKQQFITKVNPVYSFRLTLGTRSAKVSADRTDVVPFTIEIENTGNIKDIVDFKVESDYKFYELVTIHKYIPYKESRQAVLQIEPKKGSDPGVYDFTFIGTARGDKTFVEEITVSVEVVSFNFRVENLQIYDDSLTTLELNKEYDEKTGYRMDTTDTILIRADITNEGKENYISGPYGDIVITFYDGQIPIIKFRTNISYLDAGESKTVSLAWNTTVSVEDDKNWELHRIKIMIDSGDNIPENNEDDNWAFVFVNVTGRSGGGGEDTDPWDIVWKLIIPLGISLIIVIFVFLTHIVWKLIIPLGISLIIVIFVFLTHYIISTIRIEYVDTGYDDDGAYVPFAEQYDAFENEEEVIEEEEELEIEAQYDPDHPYSTSSPYQVAGQTTSTPYMLPPASPYGTVAEAAQYALPPAASESSEGADIYGFLPEGEVTGTATTQETAASVESVEDTTPIGTPVTTSKPVTTTKPPGAVTTKPATVTSKPTTVTTKPPGTVTTTKPPGTTVTTKPPATVTTTKPPASVTTKPPTSVTTKPPASVTTKPPVTTATAPSTTTTTAPATTTKPPVTTAPTTSTTTTTAPTTTTKPPESSATTPTSLKDILGTGGGGAGEEKKDAQSVTSLKDLLDQS